MTLDIQTAALKTSVVATIKSAQFLEIPDSPTLIKADLVDATLIISSATTNLTTAINSEPSIGTPSTVASSENSISGIDQATTLFKAFLRSDDLVHQIGYHNRQTKQFKNEPVQGISNAVSRAFSNSDAGLESYFAMAEYNTTESRTAANVSGANGFWMDIDVGEAKAAAGKGYLTIEDAKAALVKFCNDHKIPLPTHFVNSGGGLHVYWAVSKFVGRDTWQKYAKMLKALTKVACFLADDTRTADITSVLRVPGTYNYKYNPPRLVVLTHSTNNYIDNDLMLTTIEAAHNRLCVTENVANKTNSTSHENVGAGHTNSSTTVANMPETPVNIENVESALAAIDPDCGREEWFKTCCAIRSLDWIYGESLARAWSKGDFWNSSNKTDSKYDAQAFDIMWNSIRANAGISIGTLYHYAQKAGWVPAAYSQFDKFEVCEMVIIEPNGKANAAESTSEVAVSAKQSFALVKVNPLDQYSLRGMSGDLEKLAITQVHILGNLAISGQSTVFYAWPNTGKTLLMLYLFIEAIKQGKIDPSKLYYINVDDDLSGVILKNSYAEEYGFNMLAEGHRNFKASALLEMMRNMTDNNQCSDVIIVLDTLKKFANLMDKVNSSKLTEVVRAFVMKGGTVVALAHANKKPDSDGKPIFTGTTDIRDDFDCAYRMYPIAGKPNLKTIEFEKIKSRGNVESFAAYSYSDESGISYTERFMSVQKVDEAQLNTFKQVAELKSDAEIIGVVTTCITEGINTKTKLAFAVAELAGIGRGTVIKLIDKYTGTDTAIHKWAYSVGPKGAKVFTVLASPASDSEMPIAV